MRSQFIELDRRFETFQSDASDVLTHRSYSFVGTGGLGMTHLEKPRRALLGCYTQRAREQKFGKPKAQCQQNGGCLLGRLAARRIRLSSEALTVERPISRRD